MRMHKLSIQMFVFLVVIILLAGCSSGTENGEEQKVIYVGMIMGSGGLGDRSFNDSAYKGLQEAQRLYDIRFEMVNRTTEEADLEALRRLIRQGYDLIIGIGFENAGYIQTLSQEYPDRKFASIDVVVEGENVTSFVYREQEGDFLMGVLAAMLTQRGKIGFIGGMDIDVIHRIENGFKQGVAYQDDQVEVVSDTAGTFADPEVGKTLALAQYAGGVDLIYNAAGRTGLGIIEAAQETGNFTLGTSGDQRYLAPGSVVGNRPKRVDVAVLTLIDELINDHYLPGVRSLGLKEDGLSIGPFDENLVSQEMLQRLDDLKIKILSGEIEVQTSE